MRLLVPIAYPPKELQGEDQTHFSHADHDLMMQLLAHGFPDGMHFLVSFRASHWLPPLEGCTTICRSRSCCPYLVVLVVHLRSQLDQSPQLESEQFTEHCGTVQGFVPVKGGHFSPTFGAFKYFLVRVIFPADNPQDMEH
jgi:hypothetical protein